MVARNICKEEGEEEKKAQREKRTKNNEINEKLLQAHDFLTMQSEFFFNYSTTPAFDNTLHFVPVSMVFNAQAKKSLICISEMVYLFCESFQIKLFL